MTVDNIHIISFNVPYPPNYGGIIDVYYKVKALNNNGIKVHLHCFDYGRGSQPELDKLCSKVYYYKRNTGILKSISKVPYIINSRSNIQLLKNLELDNYPILFEGLHSTFFLTNKSLKNRVKIVRTHNIEHDYYNLLAQQEKNVFRKLYFNNAAKKLKNFEHILKEATLIAAISPKDLEYFSHKYKNAFWLPPFHSNNNINIITGISKKVLYHGNLSVVENIKAAIFLIKAFKNNNEVSVTIAGRNPSKQLIKLVSETKNFTLIPNPSDKEMLELVTNAQVHLLPTFQPTGIKLKLIASLHNGRHCIVNNEMIQGTGLEKLCHIANSADEFIETTIKLLDIPFQDSDLILRKEILGKKFDNQRNAELLLSLITKHKEL